MGTPVNNDSASRCFTAAQCRAVDSIAINDWGMPGVVLMENAGRGAADVIASLIQTELGLALSNARIAIFCGHGNNGGDGYVIARHLANRGAIVQAWATKPPGAAAPDAAINHAIAMKMNLLSKKPIEKTSLADVDEFAADIVVDALLGTGVKGAPRAPLPDVVAWCQNWRAGRASRRVIAIDVPSGMDCDTGTGLCLAADMTITFAAMKVGFTSADGAPRCGAVRLVDIGVPTAVLDLAATFGA